MKVFSALVLAVAMGSTVAAHAGEAKKATIYKPMQCGCCDEYADYLKKHGFAVDVISLPNPELVKKMQGVPQGFEGCHTMMLDGYVVEGLVPINAINKLLTEKPKIKGISLPGMPVGSPGMPGRKTRPLIIYELSGNPPKEFARE
jgi:hypothetical protein